MVGKWELKESNSPINKNLRYILDLNLNKTLEYTLLYTDTYPNDTFATFNGVYKFDIDTLTLRFDSTSTLPVNKYIIKEMNTNKLILQFERKNRDLGTIEKYERLN